MNTPCPNDTNGDGNCGRPACPHCGTPESRARGEDRRKLAAFPAMLEALRGTLFAMESVLALGQLPRVAAEELGKYADAARAALAAAEGTA